MVINRVSFLNVNFVGMTHRLRFDFGLWRPLDSELIILINVLAHETDPVSRRNMFATICRHVYRGLSLCFYVVRDSCMGGVVTR